MSKIKARKCDFTPVRTCWTLEMFSFGTRYNRNNLISWNCVCMSFPFFRLYSKYFSWVPPPHLPVTISAVLKDESTHFFWLTADCSRGNARVIVVTEENLTGPVLEDRDRNWTSVQSTSTLYPCQDPHRPATIQYMYLVYLKKSQYHFSLPTHFSFWWTNDFSGRRWRRTSLLSPWIHCISTVQGALRQPITPRTLYRYIRSGNGKGKRTCTWEIFLASAFGETRLIHTWSEGLWRDVCLLSKQEKKKGDWTL